MHTWTMHMQHAQSWLARYMLSSPSHMHAYLFSLAPMCGRVIRWFMNSNGVSGPARKKQQHVFFFSVWKKSGLMNIPDLHFLDSTITFYYSGHSGINSNFFFFFQSLVEYIIRWEGVFHLKYTYAFIEHKRKKTHQNHSFGSLNCCQSSVHEGDENDELKLGEVERERETKSEGEEETD